MLTDVADLDRAYRGSRSLLNAYLAAPPADRRTLVAGLRPRTSDYAEVFFPEVAAIAALGYRALWAEVPEWPVPPDPELHVTCATPAELATDTAGVLEFPGGYRAVAWRLRPRHIWVSWSLRQAGRSDHDSFDGLVEVEPDRWAWFPRPWNVLPRRELGSVWEIG